MRIVFVCTTNVWGSAMADLMARSLLAEWDPDRQLIQVESFGVRAKVGAPIPPAAQGVLAEFGLAAGEHRARWMSTEVLKEADLVLTIGTIHRDAALALSPRGLRRTFTLLEAARLLEGFMVAAPLAPDLDRHGRSVVAEMAAARRFRSAPAGHDDLPDVDGHDTSALHVLAEKVHLCVLTVLHALVLPEFQGHSTAVPRSHATMSAVA